MAARAAGLPIVYGAELTLVSDALRGIAAEYITPAGGDSLPGGRKGCAFPSWRPRLRKSRGSHGERAL